MRLTLGQKLTILILLIVVPLVIIIAYNLIHFFNDLENDAVNEHLRDARLVGVSLNRFTQELVREGQAAGLAIVKSDLSRPAASEYLESLRREVPLATLALLNTRGGVQASSLPEPHLTGVTNDPAFRAVLAGRAYAATSLAHRPGATPVLAVLVRTVRGTRLAGIMAVVVRARNLDHILPTGLTHDVILITDERGVLVFTTNRELARVHTRTRTLASFEPVSVALGGTEFSSKSIAIPGLGGRYLGSQVPVTSIGWTVGLYDAAGAALAHVRAEAQITLAIIAAILLLSLLLARTYAAAWITGPIAKLTGVTAEIGSGNFDAVVDVRSTDEIGLLATNFRRMQASLKHTFSDVETLAAAAREVNASLEPLSVAKTAIDYLRRVLSARDVVISLYTPTEPEPIVLAGKMRKSKAARISEKIGEIAEGLDLEGRSYVVLKVQERLTHRLADDLGNPRFVVILPLVVGGDVIGRIDVFTTPSTSLAEFERGDVTLAASFAQQVAVAIANAQLYQQQRAIADALQDSLLTKPYPLKGLAVGLVYRPAGTGTRIGGDFYDFISISGDRTALVIGDISGKGIEAARLTSVAKGAIRSFALEDPSPGKVFERANRVIAEQVGDDNFITAAYVLLDPKIGSVEYAIAGHPAPVLHNRQTDQVWALGGGSMPLGIDERTSYQTIETVMSVGDRLVLYTDGVSEARRPPEFFGEGRIMSAIGELKFATVAGLATEIAEQAFIFAGGSVDDDLAVVAVERLPGEPGPRALFLGPGEGV